ncbi:uncharacterized protein LOC131848152 [Achroia grisella]|uniref:uncharacterized protein LOC131848152 n=1 Tax=Achroia grisella TaxID=688607 RepID=UPI0027D1EB69|nr:uncharacterized protein LOC131848152 [Achroia grisella]
MDDEINSVIINIFTPRICTKESYLLIKKPQSKQMLKGMIGNQMQKTSEIFPGKYCVSVNKPISVNDLKQEEILLSYRLYAKKQESETHKQRMRVNIRDKYKIISTDMKMRLHLDIPNNDVNAITDVDKGFFSYMNRHELSTHTQLYKSLKSLLSDQLRLRQEIGFRRDGVLNIETSNRKEMEQYEKSSQRCMQQVKYFDSFISEDYHKSMMLLQQWEELKVKVNMKIVELQTFANEQFAVISRLMGLDYMYSIQQKYGRFLYYLSPPSWRVKNREFARSVEIAAKGFDLGESEEETFTVVFQKMQRECFGNFIKPVLYFSCPNDLLKIFNDVEKQQLHHLTYVTHLAPLKKILKEEIKMLKELMAQDSALLANTIKSFEILLKYTDERCGQLQNRFYNVLYGLFYESVGAPEVLKLFLHLEFSYEKVLGEKSINFDIVTMAKSLENMYMDYSKRLDTIHSDTLKLAIKQCEERERQKIRRAKIAFRELHVFDTLEKKLLRAHAPLLKHNRIRTFNKKTSITKSMKHLSPKINTMKNIRRNLNESELEYLTLFTEWTENEDPGKYLHFDENIIF